MSSNKDGKQRRNDHPLKNLPTEVLLKARSTLVSISGALKAKNEQQQRPKLTKEDSKDRKNQERLKISRSEPEFGEIRKSKHKSRVEDSLSRDYAVGARPRPLSVGAVKRPEREIDNCPNAGFLKEPSPSWRRNFNSSEDVCVQSCLVLPVAERISAKDFADYHVHDNGERPRKKLSFREPEIVGNGSATLGRSHKLMGVNSLSRKPNRVSIRAEMHSSLEGIDSDLESQAMRIVRTVGQAFEVCHKIQQSNAQDQPAPSTSSAVEDPAPSGIASDVPLSREAASDCGVSEMGAPSTSKAMEESAAPAHQPTRPTHLDFLPPPPRKDGKKSPQRLTPTPSINFPDFPECVINVDPKASVEAHDESTPLSAQHQLQLLRERLEQQVQQTRAAVAQLLLLRDQLAAEQAARCEAQARTHQLLVHNKELIEHISALVAHLHERERGSAKPINAQQLTLLPQARTDFGKDMAKSKMNENLQQINSEQLINLITQSTNAKKNGESNNNTFSPFCTTPTFAQSPGSGLSFGGMTNEQIQDYLILKFQDMSAGASASEPKTNNQQFFQNCNAFPNIPPLSNHYSHSDIASLLNHNVYKEKSTSIDELDAMAQAMSLGHSENSLCSNSQATTSKGSTPEATSSDEGVAFIMPLSHNGTWTATGEDGRVRLIVPVSPSGSTSDIVEIPREVPNYSGVTLKVPERLAPNAPITRTTSEKVPNRSEMMTALRSQWTRHTTK